MSARQRMIALAVAAVLLVGVVLAEGWYLWLRGDESPTAEHPVTVSDVTQAAAVDAASSATAEILSTSYQDYDEQATKAEALMTDTFGAQYDQTSDDIRDAFIGAKTAVDMQVVWAGVYRASAEQVQALLFLDQVVTKGEGSPTVTPYRALVTVVPSDHGWLVADIQTR